MTSLRGKKILLGISGSIAAYKAAFLTRLFVKAGADVQVLMTKSATGFISPLTLSTLSKRPVFTDISSKESWNNHVELGLWADVMVLAPLTANTLAKLANGLCENSIAATYFSARCPVFFAPAMDVDMWKHPATVKNVDWLQKVGNHLIPVGHGELASGLVGEGRMAEPEEILRILMAFFSKKEDFKNKKILITAGPTYEPIDPVRFIGNHSSGKMGAALAKILAQRGAQVSLVMGPSHSTLLHPSIKTFRVTTAEEMFQRAVSEFEEADIAILAAAVADYRPKTVAKEKIKKQQSTITIELEKNPDIAACLGKIKRQDQILAGFALETTNELKNAKEKLVKKNFDFIVLNSLREKGAGFNHDTNKISILYRDNKVLEFELKSKAKVAEDIANELKKLEVKKESHLND